MVEQEKKLKVCWTCKREGYNIITQDGREELKGRESGDI